MSENLCQLWDTFWDPNQCKLQIVKVTGLFTKSEKWAKCIAKLYKITDTVNNFLMYKWHN